LSSRAAPGTFEFVSFQSEQAKHLLTGFNYPQDMSSIIFIERGRCFIKSSAVIRIVSTLGGIWAFYNVFLLVPRPLRDLGYDLVARNRYRLFGARLHCEIVGADFGRERKLSHRP
jgi:predicted DCC family thiol-disulfide oxidoreductase YuxK